MDPYKKYTITKYPNPLLRKKMRNIEDIDDGIIAIAQRMTMTMYYSNGIGIAANQVGLNMNMAIITDDGKPGTETVLVNPRITDSHGSDGMREGCLSYPGCDGLIVRSEWVQIKYLGLDGGMHTLEADGVLSKCISHELDHLRGMTILQRMNAADKMKNRKALEVLRNNFEREK